MAVGVSNDNVNDNGNARQGDHEAHADVAPAGKHSDSGSIKRVGEANVNENENNSVRRFTRRNT